MHFYTVICSNRLACIALKCSIPRGWTSLFHLFIYVYIVNHIRILLPNKTHRNKHVKSPVCHFHAGVSGNFTAPHDVRLMEAFTMGRTIRILAVLDGILLLLQCTWFPILFLPLLWVRGTMLDRIIFLGGSEPHPIGSTICLDSYSI